MCTLFSAHACVLYWEETGCFACSTRGVCADHLPAMGWDLPTMGDWPTLLNLVLLGLLSRWMKHHSIQCLCESSFSATPPTVNGAVGWHPGLLPPVAGIVMLFAILHLVGHGSAGKESPWNAGDLGLIPGLGRSPGEGKGYALQCSGLENSMDCIVHGVAKSGTWLSEFHFLQEAVTDVTCLTVENVEWHLTNTVLRTCLLL